MDKALSYDDVLLVPNYSFLASRSEANTEVDFCGWRFKLPVVPANMTSVINSDIARLLSRNGYFYIMHRFNIDNRLFVLKANEEKWPLISISTGVTQESLDQLKLIVKDKLKVDFITIDVAHGHHEKVIIIANWIKKNMSEETKLIIGNIATPEAASELKVWGADAVKVGIGQGRICTTRFQTGFSVPMFTCVKDIVDRQKESSNFIPVIADGSIKTPGDMAKALVAGATMIMAGGIFASCNDSPAELVDGKRVYFGSTSHEAGKTKNIEGKAIRLKSTCSYLEKMNKIKEGLQSAISYAGGTNLAAFKDVTWNRVN